MGSVLRISVLDDLHGGKDHPDKAAKHIGYSAVL